MVGREIIIIEKKKKVKKGGMLPRALGTECTEGTYRSVNAIDMIGGNIE